MGEVLALLQKVSDRDQKLEEVRQAHRREIGYMEDKFKRDCNDKISKIKIALHNDIILLKEEVMEANLKKDNLEFLFNKVEMENWDLKSKISNYEAENQKLMRDNDEIKNEYSYAINTAESLKRQNMQNNQIGSTNERDKRQLENRILELERHLNEQR